MDFCSRQWTDVNFPAGSFTCEHLIDGDLSRDQTQKSCSHTIQAQNRVADESVPYANFSLTKPMKLAEVQVLSRDAPGWSRNDPFGIIVLQVLGCEDEACTECPMVDKAGLNDATEWVHFDCDDVIANRVVLTSAPTRYVIACEVQANGYVQM